MYLYIFIFGGLSHSIIRQKRAKTFVIVKTATFWNVFFSVDLVDPKEIILSFAQNLSKNLVDPYDIVF